MLGIDIIKILVRFIIAGDMKLVIKAPSWREMVSGCYNSRGGINITRTRHDVALYVHCLGHTYFCPFLVMYINIMQGNSSRVVH